MSDKNTLADACAGQSGTSWSANLRGVSIATAKVVENTPVRRLPH